MYATKKPVSSRLAFLWHTFCYMLLILLKSNKQIPFRVKKKVYGPQH